MADIRLTTGFSTVMGPDQDAITRLLTETIGDTELAEAVNSWLDEWDSIDDNPA